MQESDKFKGGAGGKKNNYSLNEGVSDRPSDWTFSESFPLKIIWHLTRSFLNSVLVQKFKEHFTKLVRQMVHLPTFFEFSR